MRILRPIVFPKPLLGLAGQSQTPERRGVGAQLVGDHQFRRETLLLEQLAHQPERRPAVARRWTNMSRTSPSWSTARHRYIRSPATDPPSRRDASDRSAASNSRRADADQLADAGQIAGGKPAIGVRIPARSDARANSRRSPHRTTPRADAARYR